MFRLSSFLHFVVSSFLRPDLVDYNKLKRSNPTHNLQNAFNVAEQKLGVTKLLDPEGECLMEAAPSRRTKRLWAFSLMENSDLRAH